MPGGNRHTPDRVPACGIGGPALVYFIRLVAALTLLVGLFLDARQQPRSTHRYSCAGCISHAGWHARVSRARPPNLLITQTVDGLVIRETEDFPDPLSSRHLDPAGDIQYLIRPRRWEQYWGLWAITDYTVSLQIWCWTDYPSHSDASPPAHIRTAAATWLRDEGWIDPVVCAKASVADVKLTRPVPGGRTHTFLALGLLVFALALLPWRQTIHAIHRCFPKASPGLCDECGYDLTGLRSDTCPECGEPLLNPIIAATGEPRQPGVAASEATDPR